jgi:hypothetical protein
MHGLGWGKASGIKTNESHLAATIVRQHVALEPSAGLGRDTN